MYSTHTNETNALYDEKHIKEELNHIIVSSINFQESVIDDIAEAVVKLLTKEKDITYNQTHVKFELKSRKHRVSE